MNWNSLLRLDFGSYNQVSMALMSKTRSSVRRLTVMVSSNATIHDSLPRRPVKLSPDVERDLDDGVYVHRRHAGRVVRNRISLPDRFRRTAVELLSRTPSVHSSSDAVVAFSRYLVNRKPLIEDDVLRRKAVQMENDLLDERKNYPESSASQLDARDKNHILNVLRQNVYHWKPIEYTDGMALTYLCARAAPDFAVLTQIFQEIKQRSPKFAPKALFDFGSGIGTSIWAADGVWPNHFQEYFAVDTSSHMNDVARLLMQDGQENRSPFIKGTFFRQFLPASHTLRYDLVVSAFSLMELPNRSSRRQTLENLWNKTEDFLVIVETGSNAGYGLVMEARSHLLRHAKECEPKSIEVFAPCSHSLKCPRLAEQDIPCNFEVGYKPLVHVPPSRRDGKRHDRFSYVVLRKMRAAPIGDGECPSSSSKESWPRIVSEVLVRPRHVVCRTCDSNGRLGEVIVTASKHGSNMYRCAKASRWGDRLPITTVSEVSKIKDG